MASGMYTASFAAFFGGDIDFVNDRISAVLVDTSVYTPDLTVDENIGDIPEDAILSETLLTGRFITDDSLFADAAVFQNVEDTGLEATAVIVFVDAETHARSTLCFYYDESVNFPYTPTGGDVTVLWPEEGLLVAQLPSL